MCAQAGALPYRPSAHHRVPWCISRQNHGSAFAHRVKAPAEAPLLTVGSRRYPYAYRGCTGGPQEEEAFSMGCARYIEEKLFKTILAPEEVAAIFVEPIQ